MITTADFECLECHRHFKDIELNKAIIKRYCPDCSKFDKPVALKRKYSPVFIKGETVMKIQKGVAK